MGTKRGGGRGSFIDSILAAVDAFYGEVLQDLKAWSAAPPKMRHPDAEKIAVEQPAPTNLVSTGFSSQDQPADDSLPSGPPAEDQPREAPTRIE